MTGTAFADNDGFIGSTLPATVCQLSMIELSEKPVLYRLALNSSHAMRFTFGQLVEHPDFVLGGKILVVNATAYGYIIEDRYTGKIAFYPDDDEQLQLNPDQT